jgi:hypothetical protein
LNQPYSATISVTGGTAPYRFSLSSGKLPTGLTFASSGAVSGMPSAAGTFGFTISVLDAKNLSAQQSFQVTVSNSPSVTVAVSPSSASLAAGAVQQFGAVVSNTSNLAVTWTASAGTVSSKGVYTAPQVTSNSTAAVTATSAADPTRSATALITITPPAIIGIAIAPSAITLGSGATAQFSALVTNTTNTGVTWKTSSGTISSTGFFTAPQVSANTTATVTATSVADPTKSAGASVSITAPPVVGVVVTPATASVASGTGQQFSALVSNTSNVAITWSATKGVVSTSGYYTAPQVTSNTSATVTATSVADPTKSASSSVTITATSVTPLSITSTSPASATAGSAYSYSFTAAGGKTPYTWALSSGSAPPGIALQSGGTMAGTTSQTGSFSFSVQVSDSSSPRQTASKSFTLTVGSSGGTGPKPSATFFGFSENGTNPGNFPTVSYAMQRFWDSPPLQWPSLNTAPGVFNFTTLDSALAQAYSSGVMDGMYTLARTPPWATSKPADTTCHYTTAAFGGGNGECDPPADLNPDGSGSNATWKAWITAIATHVNDPTYLQSHAHIKYWEIWNEPDTQPFWAGSIAQLARLTEDANCIITGRGVIHESGNGTATACTATAVDPSAQIVMASAHAKGVALTFGQNELYCNHTKGIPSYQLPCPNPSDAIANAIDIVNFHMKPGNESGNNCPAPTPCTPESAMTMYVANVESILQPAERAKPLWDGEASYSEYGFTGAYSDQDMAASFMPRYYLINWSLGISGNAWYAWDALAAQPASVQAAYQQAYDWLANSSLDSPCSASGTVWSCLITKSGTQYLILWDSSQSCSAGVCTSSKQSVGSQWSAYQDITLAGAQVSISSHTVPVGIKPIALH